MQQKTGKRHVLRIVSLLMVLVLSVGSFLTFSPAPVTRAKTLDELQDRLEALEKEEEALKDQLADCKNDVARQQEYANSLKGKIQNSEEQIELLRQQVELLMEQMDEKAAQIEEKGAAILAREEEIAQAEQRINDQIALFGERLRVIAQTGNLSSLQMLFNTENYLDYLLKAAVVNRIAQSDQRQIDALNGQIEDLNGEIAKLDEEKVALDAERAALDAERQEIEALKAVADGKKQELDALYAECNKVLANLQSSVDAVNAQLAQKQREEEALDREIKRILESMQSTGRYTGGTMYWPVPTVKNISSYYGHRWGTLHRGIDIANGSIPIYGENIVAASDGTVIHVNPAGWGGGYGLFVMVDHGLDNNGRQIVTLYAHMSATLVSVGQKVRGGQTVLGRAGSSGNVTGPHLHFEVRVNGTGVDPLANGYLKLNS